MQRRIESLKLDGNNEDDRNTKVSKIEEECVCTFR